ncbi:LysR family transcriptional regulator [Ruegeria profundi]|uniref:HTH lysR-type domain-containing protein n=1 Tax=Ruegeria profundi TaxID=1685378 RepID=A0A0X3U0J8_9RHOB|nr:LysR family transcriptional regulator [Ruegeria profundi]KUJ81382.1 hypothetical protein AVO44_05920 [Ruegeria profundi]
MPLSRLPSLLSLRAFEAAARRGSIKEAAYELSVTPGAVSQQIKALEADLGVALFVRKTRAIHLTPEGQRLQPTISEAFLQIRQVVDEVRPKKTPKLRISSSNALISKWLLPRLHKFTKDHPDVQVHIESENPSDHKTHATADIEIRYNSEPPEDRYTELLHRELMLVVASPGVLDTFDIKSPADIKAAQVLYDTTPMLDGSVPSWVLWSQHAGLPNVVDPSKAMRFERPPGGQIVDAAIAGAGVALCGSLLVYSALSDGRLVCPFGPVVETGFSYFICCHPGREREEHIREFMSWARKEAAVLSTLNAMREPSPGADIPVEVGG